MPPCSTAKDHLRMTVRPSTAAAATEHQCWFAPSIDAAVSLYCRASCKASNWRPEAEVRSGRKCGYTCEPPLGLASVFSEALEIDAVHIACLSVPPART